MDRHRPRRMRREDEEEPRYSEYRKCSHCGYSLNDEQKYCTRCGHPTADAENVRIRVNYRDIASLYGPPPVIAEIVCPVCGKQWRTSRRRSDTEDTKRYCPHCGAFTDVRNFQERW